MCILYLLPDSLALAGGDGVALHKARLPGVQEGNNAVVSARLIAPVEQERVVQQREVLAAVACSRVKQKGRAVCVRDPVEGKLDARRGILEVDAAAVGTARDLASVCDLVVRQHDGRVRLSDNDVRRAEGEEDRGPVIEEDVRVDARVAREGEEGRVVVDVTVKVGE